ncbi:N-acetylmuramoyl-L-alanine amidase [Actinopolymorpha singaporensis]
MRRSFPRKPRKSRSLRVGVATAAVAAAALAMSGVPAVGARASVQGAGVQGGHGGQVGQSTQGSTTAGVSASGQAAFVRAAREYAVPLPVLLGVSYLETRWDAHQGRPSMAGGYGPMHLTDLAAATARDGAPAPEERGDPSRPGATRVPRGPAFQSVDLAARLTGLGKATLRTEPAANIRGGAAVLAEYQRRLGGAGATDPGDWYGAVAAYSGATEQTAARSFADEVYAQIRKGATRTTDDGRRVTLAATDVRADRSWLRKLGLHTATNAAEQVECPAGLGCEWIPAPYQELGDGDYGNHDLADRPNSQKVRYIVIHSTEDSYAGTIRLAQDPTYVSWHYTLRDSDGHIAQHVATKDVAWHAGNWYVNAKSIGLEHEGYAARGDWFTEVMYRNSASLVRYLAAKYDIPLDRQHILGHDNVPGVTPGLVEGMHWDPGPYWDWAHYFELLGAPFTQNASSAGGVVTIKPNFATNRPVFTHCEDNPGPPSEGRPRRCRAWPSSAVLLHTEPRQDAPLLRDVGSNPPDGVSTTNVADIGSRVSTGQQYAVAEVRGEWTAIWYLGQKGWFFNPADAPRAVWTKATLVKPKQGKASVQIYGRAYPEAAAYPPDVPVQALVPLQYTWPAGQDYVLGLQAEAEYYRAVTFDPADHQVIRGQMRYYQVQFGHRVGYVLADDVDLVSPTG